MHNLAMLNGRLAVSKLPAPYVTNAKRLLRTSYSQDSLETVEGESLDLHGNFPTYFFLFFILFLTKKSFLELGLLDFYLLKQLKESYSS